LQYPIDQAAGPTSEEDASWQNPHVYEGHLSIHDEVAMAIRFQSNENRKARRDLLRGFLSAFFVTHRCKCREMPKVQLSPSLKHGLEA
jgi:hypothetical protein